VIESVEDFPQRCEWHWILWHALLDTNVEAVIGLFLRESEKWGVRMRTTGSSGAGRGEVLVSGGRPTGARVWAARGWADDAVQEPGWAQPRISLPGRATSERVICLEAQHDLIGDVSTA